MGEKVVQELLDVLERQQQLHQELFQIAKAKQPILVKGDLTALNEFTIREEKLVVQVGKLEELRSRAQQALANHFNMPAEELTLQNLAAKVPGELHDRLAQLGEGLRTLLQELKNINSMNSELVQRSLQYIDFTVNVIAGVDDLLGYEKPGETTTKEQQAAAAKIFDRRI